MTGGSVFMQDFERGKRVVGQIDTGMVFINHPIWTQANLPFGGTKGSGYGPESFRNWESTSSSINSSFRSVSWQTHFKVFYTQGHIYNLP